MMETLQCHLLEIDLSQAKVLLLSYNRPHQSMEAWEEAVALKDLLETHNLDQRRLAKLTGYNRSWVSRRLSLIEKMDEQVSSEIMMGVLTGSHARALTKLPLYPYPPGKKVLGKGQANPEEDVYDPRLSGFGNDLMQSAGHIIHGLQVLLSRLDDQRIGLLNETEKVIIIPVLRKASGYAENLTKEIIHLQIQKPIAHDER